MLKNENPIVEKEIAEIYSIKIEVNYCGGAMRKDTWEYTGKTSRRRIWKLIRKEMQR